MTAIRRQRDPSLDARSDPVPATASEQLAQHYGYGHWHQFSFAANASPESDRWGYVERAAAEYLWATWERHLGVARPSPRSIPRLVALNGAIYQALQATLDGPRFRSYGQAIDQLEADTLSWESVIGPSSAAYWRHGALLWLALTHFTQAGVPPETVESWIKRLGTLDAEPAREPDYPSRRPDLRLIVDRSRAAVTPFVQKARESWPGIVTNARHVTIMTAKGLAAGYAWARRVAAEQADAHKRHRQAAEAARERAAAEHEARLATAQAARLATSSERPAAGSYVVNAEPRPLDGHRLRTSVVGTWLMLVVLSWVSLIWGAILTAPFGIGVAVIASFLGGIVAVPLWGTLFGFIGMSAARSSTLTQMRFEPLPGTHPIAGVCARYCAVLAIPVPQLGTIRDCNAFAMGLDHRHATVALGRPLLDNLSTAEVNAVLAHELGHVVSGDMRKMMLMRTFQNATVWFMMFQGMKQFARWIICWAAELAILAFSRNREYWADAIGAALAGKEAMIGALRKLEGDMRISSDERRHARFMFRAPGLSTHPTMAQRIRALEEETYMRRLPLRTSS